MYLAVIAAQSAKAQLLLLQGKVQWPTIRTVRWSTSLSVQLAGELPGVTHLPAKLMAIVGAPTNRAKQQNSAAIHHRKVKYIM